MASMGVAMGEEHGIHIVPLYVTFDTQQYRDDVDLDSDQFYRLLRESKQPPTTSQPTVADFINTYIALAEEATAIVSVHGSKKLSATVDSARAAAKELPDVPIHVIDTQSVSVGQALMAIEAARVAAAGREAAEVVQRIESLSSKVRVIFTVETLEYLRRGGRIGGAAALMGSLLSIKPILHIENGQVEPLEKPRTRKRAVQRLLAMMAEFVDPSKPIHAAVLHCDAPEDGQAFADQVNAQFQCTELLVAEAGPTIGTHAGPGTIGVGFYSE
jgi:DegV family protein with EDD domain